MMTTMAALLAAVPLALGTGDGAEFRQPLGISIVGGLIVSQMLTLYTTPVVYLYLDRFSLWTRRLARRPRDRCRTRRPQPGTKRNDRRTRDSGARARAEARGVGCLRGVRAVRMLGRSELRATRPSESPPGIQGSDTVEARPEPRDQQPRGQWWEVFTDPKLDALVAQVDISNQTIKGAEARVREARALTQSARAALFPTGQRQCRCDSHRHRRRYARTNSDGSIVQAEACATAITSRSTSSWEVDLWGGVRRTVEAERGLGAGERRQISRSAKLSARAQLAEDYFLLRVQDAQITPARTTRWTPISARCS